MAYCIDEHGNMKKKTEKKKQYYIDKDGEMRTREVEVEVKEEKKKKTGFFQTPKAFKDGYQFGDITGTILGTAVDTVATVGKGAGRLVEGVGDLALYGASEVADFFGADSADKWLKGVANANAIDTIFAPYDNTLGKYSVWGDTSSAILEGVGQVGGMIATGGLGSAAKLGMLGTTALTTGTMFASSMGAGISEAYQSGASDGKAWAYGLMKGGIDAASEMLFGGLGKAVKALGFSRGISSLDDIFAKKATEKITNHVLKNAVQYGIKASGEGLEEVLAGAGSAFAKWLTYARKEDLLQLVKDENLLEQFIVGAISSGVVQSPGAYSSIKNRTDFITGLSANEEAVVEAEANKRIKAKEAEGTKVTAKEKNKIYEDVKKDLERGYIDVDTIESTLMGDSYKSYKSMSEQRAAMQEEYDELYQRKDRDKSDADRDRQKELKAQLEELTASTAKAREQLDTDMKGIIQNSRLAESYNERTRRSQAYEADLTKYNEAERAVVQKAMESGILNNTNRTHDFVDMLAKISAEKGVSFDFINNQRLKESGFALEGKMVNGFIKDGNISLNIESAKALNTVVGHEITHVLEGTELYGELQQAVKAFAESKGEYGKRLEALQKLYAGVEGANIENELTADLIGDYLFTDSDFVNRLSTEKPGLFKRIFEEIKYLVKTATAGSKQAQELEKVKRTFEKAYRESSTVTAGTRYSISEKMTSTERYEELKDKNIVLADVKNNDILDSYSLEGKSLNDIYKFVRENREALNLNKSYQKEDIKIEFDYSNGGIKKSLRQTAENKVDAREYLDILSCLGEIINSSILIERHGDKSGNADSRLKQVYVLMGAYKKGESIVPVQLEIKENVGMDNQLYLAVTIKKSEVNDTATTEVASASRSDFSVISIADLIKYVNPEAADFLKYIPTEFLSDAQIKGKIEGLRKDVEKYPNSPFNQELEELGKKYETETIKSSLSDNDVSETVPAGNYNVHGKDIMLDLPIREELRKTEDIAPAQQSQTQKELGPVRADIVQKDVPNTEGDAPAEQAYSPDELPTWENVKKQEADTYAPEPESYLQKKVTTVKERNAAKLQNLKVQLKNEQDLMKKSHDSYNAEIRDLQSECQKTCKALDDVIHELQYAYDKKKNKTSKTAQELLDRIERRKITRDRVKRESEERIERRKSSRDNTDAFYEKRIQKLKKKIDRMNTKEFKIVEQRISKQEEYQTTLGELMGDTSTWVDKKMGIYYKVNTLRRNLRDIVRDENGNRDIAKADAIYDELQGKYNHNEAKLNREANEIKAKYAGLKITAEEDAYIQMLGEYRHNPDTTLTADAMTEFYEKHKKKIDTEKVEKIISSARQLYDELFHRVNATLEEHGMRPIEYREGYFPHFTDDKQGWLAKLLNWKTKKDNIPTDIAGLTEQFKPVRSYQSFDKHRTGDSTDYSFKKGLDMYVQGALDWIYHIGDIQKRRAFENEIRYRHSDQGIKDKVEAIRNNPEYDASEVQDQIDLVYKEAKNPLNNFISDFRTQTNTLAGKKSSMDRGTEEWSNRKFYSTMQNISNRVTANMVVGSLSSALTNFIPITQSLAQVSPMSSLRAMRDTIKSYIRKDSSVIDNSDFLTNRLRKSEKLYQSTWDRVINKAGIMMEAIDNFTSQVVWRSKYLENMSAKMSESEAIKNADQFAENVMAGRSRGNNPTIFDAKNPFIKVATAFQLEVNNQYGYLFKDVPQDIKNEAKGNLLKSYAGVFIGAWLYNMAYSALTGRDAALDPIGIIEDILKDFGLGDDEEPEEPAEIVGNLAESVLEELPFVGGFLGGGRIPISSALPYKDSDGVVGALGDFTEDVANFFDGGWKNIGKELENPASYLLLPAGGGQIRKSIQGLQMFDDDLPIAGSYTDSGDLRFAVEDTPLKRLQAFLFGQWSSKNAREYIEEGRSPLGEKQTQELIDTDLPMADYWKYRDGLKGKSSNQDKIEYIADLDLPIDTKNILVNNVVQRETPIDLTDYDKFAEYEEFDFFCRNKEMYNFLKENEISYAEYKGYNDKAKDACRNLMKYPEKKDFMAENGVSVSDYCSFDAETKEAYDWAYKNPDKYKLSQYITEDVVEYRKMVEEIGEITADKGRGGVTIPNSKNKKIVSYINNLDMDTGQKMILYRMVCSSDNSYNYRIVEYLNGRDDISRSEMEFILQGLGMTVTKDGKVRW